MEITLFFSTGSFLLDTNLRGQRARMLILVLLPILALYGISAYHITVTIDYLNNAGETREVMKKLRYSQLAICYTNVT